VDLKPTPEQVQSLCSSVTPEQRRYCEEHLGRPDFPEVLMSECTRESPDVEIDATPLDADTWWWLLLQYKRVGESRPYAAQ
jgi:hypothetical protein